MSTHSTPPANLSAEAPATAKQIDYIKSLVEQKDLGEHRDWMHKKLADIETNGITKAFASKLIGRLVALPRKPVPATVTAYAEQTLWEIPAGRYALVNDKADEADTNPVLFYRVSVGKEGTRWEGRRFVERIVGGDHNYPVKGAQATQVLGTIHADILGAAKLYGKEIGKCSNCNRTLTRRLSRELGVGPVCAEKLGMSADDIQAVKDELISAGLDPEETIA